MGERGMCDKMKTERQGRDRRRYERREEEMEKRKEG